MVLAQLTTRTIASIFIDNSMEATSQRDRVGPLRVRHQQRMPPSIRVYANNSCMIFSSERITEAQLEHRK